MLDNTTFVGVVGSFASVGLADYNPTASFIAAVLTSIYMLIQIFRAIRKKKE